MSQARFRLVVLGASALLTSSCAEDGPIPYPVDPPAPDPGALISVVTDSQVGALLEDFPPAMRDRVADALIAKDEAFWRERVFMHMRMTMVRLNFRHYFHEPFYYTDEGRKQMPLPVEGLWRIRFDKGPPTRTKVDGHDLVTVGYHFETTILTTPESPAQSDPALADIDGVVEETFQFPVDPTLQLEHMGYACMDEYQYTPDSVDSENTVNFFDDTCTGGPEGICHVTEQADDDCVDAIKKTVGLAPTVFRFTRLAWDPALADAVRVGEVVSPNTPELAVRTDYLAHNRLEYRYFAPDDCALEEQCIGAPGWRRILKFDAMDHNIGGKLLVIGAVNYANDPAIANEEIENHFHNNFQWSACHKHYHFAHYGEFAYSGANAPNPKRGFCLQSTNRMSNNEQSPLYTPTGDCNLQGIDVGWGDLYQGGLPCQWIDVTDLKGDADPVSGQLSFHSNPDGFLCEGTPVKDEAGKQVWEPTLFTTKEGDPVDRPVCIQNPNTEENSFGQVAVQVSRTGGFMTSPCQAGQLGPLRTCGFDESSEGTCTPGATVKLSCSVPKGDAPMTTRICEKSVALGLGTACTYRKSLANSTLTGSATEVTFKCPEARDADEPGGAYTVYSAPTYPDDPAQPIACTVMN